VARWQPDSRGRLAKAALVLYDDQGFENTTVAEIAEAAGVTERTFFRHFPDKREVLFAGGIDLGALAAEGVAAAPPGLAPLDAAMAGLNEFVAVIGGRHEFAARRRRIIDTNPELRERDLIKNAEMSATLAGALRDYGLEEESATLAAEAAVGVFRVAWDRWTANAEEKTPLADLVAESLKRMRALTAAP
jgi:AcrR family transcriptional regulator